MAKTENGFVRRIKELRASTGLKGEDFGKLFGVSKVTIHRWETGGNYPNQDIMFKICDYFNCSLDYLMGRTNIKHSADKISSNDFLIAFDKLLEDLSEDDKKVILKMAQGFANSNGASKKKNDE